MLDVFFYGSGIKQNVQYDKSAYHVSEDVINPWNGQGVLTRPYGIIKYS